MVKLGEGQEVVDHRADLDDARHLVRPAFDLGDKEEIDDRRPDLERHRAYPGSRRDALYDHRIRVRDFQYRPRGTKRVRICERRKLRPKADPAGAAKTGRRRPVTGGAAASSQCRSSARVHFR